VQVDPIKPVLKLPRSKRLKLEHAETLLNFAFNFNFRRYSEGAAVARPLWYEFPDDPAMLEKQDAMMLGPAILVHPVLQQGATSVTVYLPEGVWYDMDTNVKHVGPTTFEYPVTMADTPTFIRGGHVVVRRDRARRSTVRRCRLTVSNPVLKAPTVSALMKLKYDKPLPNFAYNFKLRRYSTVAMAADPFTIVVAPDAAGHAVGEIYLDDGKSFGFQQGAFVRRALTFTAGAYTCPLLSSS
jgi:alpha 1,3-glucosidase